MKTLGIIVFVIIFYFNGSFCEESCNIDVNCDDCLPDNLPVVLSHSAAENILNIKHGDEVHLNCHETKFIAYPEKNSIKAFCENGRFRVLEDNLITNHLSELGCLADHYEDVLHEVEFCQNPFQGRSYQHRHSIVFHLVEICYDTDLGQTVFAHMTISKDNNIDKIAHTDDSRAKLSILGNFNMMFDKSNKIEAEKVFTNNIAMNKKSKFMLENFNFYYADQTLASTKLLPSIFFYNQNGRVTKFISNKAALWKSVANGNFKNLQNDIVYAFKRNETKNVNDTIHIYVGTYEVLSLNAGDQNQKMYLKPGKKYPVPKYVWTIVFNENEHKAVVLVVINNPFISISEIRQGVFCPSLCNSLNWIKHLKKSSNYERGAYGLVFCCDIHSFAKVVKSTPNIMPSVHMGERGVLKDSLP